MSDRTDVRAVALIADAIQRHAEMLACLVTILDRTADHLDAIEDFLNDAFGYVYSPPIVDAPDIATYQEAAT